VGLRAGLDAEAKRKVLYLCRGSHYMCMGLEKVSHEGSFLFNADFIVEIFKFDS
jgi:hypothetical protein